MLQTEQEEEPAVAAVVEQSTTPVTAPVVVSSAAAMYIQNPVDRELNVSQNVTEDITSAFRRECHLAGDTLEDEKLTNQMWGVAAVCLAKRDGHALEESSRQALTQNIGNIFND